MDVFSQFTPELTAAWDDAMSHDHHHYPFYQKTWHMAWLSSLGVNEQPMIIADVPTHTLIPLAVKNGTAHFSGGEEIADYLDAIGPDNAKEAIWKKAIGIIKMQGATQLLLRNIPQDSPTISFFQSQPHVTVEKEDTTPLMTLPDAFDAFTSSLERKDRHELKRKLRKFETSYPGSAVTVKHGNDTDMMQLIKFMKRDSDKQTFLTDSMQTFFQNLPDTAGDMLTQHTLTIDDRTIATAVSFRTNTSLLLYNSGYNDAYVGSGFYLKAKMIDWAISKGISTYNFLQGNERYKYELGGKDFFVYRVELAI